MNTSSRVGRATLIARMRTPSSANRRGTNSSPPTTWKVTASSLMAASRPKRSRSAAIAAASSSLRRVTRSLPTLAFSSSGVPSTTMVPLSMMAMRSQYSASSHVVGGEEHGDRLTPPQLVQVGPDLAAGLRVEPDGGLVQEQHPWGVEQAARDLQAALHPAREGAHLAAAPLTEPDQVQDLVQAGGHGVARDPVQLGVEAQVLLGGEVVVQGGVLEDQADAPPHLGLALDHVEAGHAGAPRARPQQRAQHRDGGRLAGAVGPQEPEGLAGRDAEAHAADGLDLVEPRDQALGLDGGGAVGRGPGRGLDLGAAFRRPAGPPFGAERRQPVLDPDDFEDLVEVEAHQLLELADVLEAGDVVVGVAARAAGGAAGGGQQAELLVVPQGAAGDAHPGGSLADPQLSGPLGHADIDSSASDIIVDSCSACT